MTHALYLARRALADGGEPMLLPQGGWQGDWGSAVPVETAFAESYGSPSGPYGNPTPGPIAVESSPLGAFNSGSGDTSGAAAPGSGRGPSLGYAAQPSPWGGLPSEINNGYSVFGGLPSSIETGRPGAFGSEMNASPIDIGAQDYGAYGSLNTGPLDKGYGAFGGLPTEIVTGRETPNPYGSLSYGQFSQPNVGINDWSSPASRDFGSFDYSHLDGMDFGGSPASSYGAALGSSPRGSSYNGAFAGQPFDMQGDYGTGGKNSTRAGNVGQYGAPVTTGMTPGFAAPSKGVAFGDESFADFGKGITVAPAIPTGFYDPMTGFSANLSGWGGGGGGDYAGGGFGGGAPGLGGGVMGGDPAMGGGDRGMARGGRVDREDGGRISPFGEADDVALQRAAKFAGMVQTPSREIEYPRHALEARLAPDEAARMDLSGYMMPNRAASVVNTEAGAELRDPDGNKVD